MNQPITYTPEDFKALLFMVQKCERQIEEAQKVVAQCILKGVPYRRTLISDCKATSELAKRIAARAQQLPDMGYTPTPPWCKPATLEDVAGLRETIVASMKE